MTQRSPESLARGYYESIDAGDYDRLSGLLADDFRQVRGDRTLEGRETFVRFMREERPVKDTTHEVDAVYRSEAGDEVAIRGRMRRPDGSVGLGFVDVFAVEGDRLSRLDTYSNRRIE